jgi:hypothetical protein
MHGLIWGGDPQFVLSGYNKSFGNATAFYIEAPLIPGFHLKCGASQSPDSQRFDCAFSAPTALNPLGTLPVSWRALLPTVPTQGSTRSVLSKSLAGRNRTPVGLATQAVYFSLYMKPGSIGSMDFLETRHRLL